MSWRRRSREFLYLLLAVLLVIPGVIAPMQGVAGELDRLAAVSDIHAASPCDMHGAAAMGEMPCDCCTPHGCDLAACLGISCLPELPAITAGLVRAGEPVQWKALPVPTIAIDTPLRPPKA